MITETTTGIQRLLADKDALRRVLDRVDRELGITRDPAATAEQSRAFMLAEGVKPEDNIGSRDLMRTRYSDDEDES